LVWDLTLSREVGRVNATAENPRVPYKVGKLFHGPAERCAQTAPNIDGAVLALACGMTTIKDSQIAAVVVLLGAVLISGLLRAFSF
jgi:hypothetical protein